MKELGSWELSFKFEERRSGEDLAERKCTDVKLESSCDKQRPTGRALWCLRSLRASSLPNVASMLGIIFASCQQVASRKTFLSTLIVCAVTLKNSDELVHGLGKDVSSYFVNI